MGDGAWSFPSSQVNLVQQVGCYELPNHPLLVAILRAQRIQRSDARKIDCRRGLSWNMARSSLPPSQSSSERSFSPRTRALQEVPA